MSWIKQKMLAVLESGMRGLGRVAGRAKALADRARRRPRPVSESSNLLPTLIKVYAGFVTIDEAVMEEEIDSSLGFLRYDYPDAVYSELRRMFRAALHERQDLEAIADKLSGQLSEERKLLLGIQLFDLISKAGLKQEQIKAYYSFMERLGMAAQAIDIVYQLNAEGATDREIFQNGRSPLEVLAFGTAGRHDVFLPGLTEGETLFAFRYHELILLKNATDQVFILQGRAFNPGELGRVYPNQRLQFNDRSLAHQDFVFYFNAKKNVSTAHVFISVSDDSEVRIDREKDRESSIEVIFGLDVVVRALADVDATLLGQPLVGGSEIHATLDDRILFAGRSELLLGELRRRARTFGRRFRLEAAKLEYLVSNQPALLEEGDILLTPGTGGDVLLRIECDYEEKVGRVEVLQADRPILVRGVPVRHSARLEDGDVIRINPAQQLRCNFSERLIEEERNIISAIEARDVICRFPEGTTALDGVSFSAHRGEMICVMGASGCGKSTLLRALSGQFAPVQGEILFNGRSLYDHYEDLREYVVYIPQFDAFDENLTIEENLEFAAAIRAPHLSRKERLRRIDAKLAELGLNERRRSVVGSVHRKTLSGGERKRLNIGLDMISTADIYLFDEPTSGLSSKDSEHVVEIIRSMAHNKIVLVTIHQPTTRIFEMFQKVILLDRGGKLVFFGTIAESLRYFAEAAEGKKHGLNPPIEQTGSAPCEAARPEFIFDVLETPLRDLSGDIIYEEDARGQLVPARRYSPDYWRDKYEAWRMMREVREESRGVPRERQIPAAPSPPRSPNSKKHDPFRWASEWGQFRTLFARAFISKLRNEANLAITLIMAPLLALLIGIVLRYSEAETYDFASAFHIPAYLFLSVVVAMFLGLTNSVDDIIRDRPLLVRERNLNLRLGYYVTAKALSLAIFAAVQCALFTWIGNWLLAVRGIEAPMFFYLFLTAMSGVGIGLLISSLVMESKTAVLLIPAVFIPQIILGGSFIKYEEMNRNLDLVHAATQWFERHPGSSMEPASDLRVPLICEFNPMRWSYEAVVYAQAKLNPLTSRQRRIQTEIRRLVRVKDLGDKEADRLDQLKELLAILSGLEAATPRELSAKLREVDRVLGGETLKREALLPENSSSAVGVEQLFINQKVVDLVSKAEMEQSDYRASTPPNVFFGPVKNYLGIRAGILVFNAGVLVISTLAMFFALYWILRRQLHGRRHP